MIDVEHHATGRRRAATLWGIAIAVSTLFVAGFFALTAVFTTQAAQDTPAQAGAFAEGIDDALARLAHLPYVLAIDPIVLDAFEGEGTSALNPVLATVAEKSGAEFVFLMDPQGLTIASSNYTETTSLIGNSYRFRPYFRDAIDGRMGRFYAVGVTTGRPGYFISEPVRDGRGIIRGVVVVKLGFADVTRAMAGSGALLLVTNAQGVVLASTDQTLVYGLLAPLDDVDAQTLRDQQQFGGQALTPLDWQTDDARRVRLDGTGFIWTQAALSQENWTLHLLSDIGDIRREALLWVAIGLTVVLAVMIAGAMFRAAQLRKALTLSNTARRRLEREIDERQQAEARLEKARIELARQNQLAALGQLSASITHELGQPISAMRNYLAADEIAADALPGQLSPQLTGLVDRMQRILDQLRLFGHSQPVSDATFVVQDAVNAATQLVRHTARDADVDLQVRQPKKPLRAVGHVNRFEQVIVNLLRNAIDATDGAGTVTLDTRAGDGSIEITVTDTGVGIGTLSMDALREPFFSTKPSGQGMGLGLAISAQIVGELNGELTAHNGAQGGAVFSVTLPNGDQDA